MTKEQLLQELTIRFNTDPKRYEKLDYRVLIKLLEALVLQLDQDLIEKILRLLDAIDNTAIQEQANTILEEIGKCAKAGEVAKTLDDIIVEIPDDLARKDDIPTDYATKLDVINAVKDIDTSDLAKEQTLLGIDAAFAKAAITSGDKRYTRSVDDDREIGGHGIKVKLYAWKYIVLSGKLGDSTTEIVYTFTEYPIIGSKLLNALGQATSLTVDSLMSAPVAMKSDIPTDYAKLGSNKYATISELDTKLYELNQRIGTFTDSNETVSHKLENITFDTSYLATQLTLTNILDSIRSDNNIVYQTVTGTLYIDINNPTKLCDRAYEDYYVLTSAPILLQAGQSILIVTDDNADDYMLIEMPKNIYCALSEVNVITSLFNINSPFKAHELTTVLLAGRKNIASVSYMISGLSNVFDVATTIDAHLSIIDKKIMDLSNNIRAIMLYLGINGKDSI